MKNLFKNLAAFQQEVPVIHKGTQGYGYSYANLSTIFEVINPLLKKHGLGFTQLVGHNEIKTIIFDIQTLTTELNTRRTGDITFYTNSYEIVNEFLTISQFSNLGATQNSLISIIGTDKLKQRLGLTEA